MMKIETAAIAVLSAAVLWMPSVPAAAHDDPVTQAALAAERHLGARVGFEIRDTHTGRTWRYRADERFPMASTAKTLVCAALLRQGSSSMSKPLPIQQSDLLSYAPVTKDLVGQAIPASDLCAITMRTSDNTAVNAVLAAIGGPQAVTSMLRMIGDPITRLDRNEPSMNEGKPGDLRDTTSPRAMAQTIGALVLGSALDEASATQLTDWLISNEVGGPLLRAGVPVDWRVADRTGNGGYGTRGIAAVMWPPGRAPVVAAIYMTETDASIEDRNAAIASIGKALAFAVGGVQPPSRQ